MSKESQWRPIHSAPKDGTMILLLCVADDPNDLHLLVHPTEDEVSWRTIGFNNLDDDGEDVWRTAGWCWVHDEFTEGHATPTGWMPLPGAEIPG